MLKYLVAVALMNLALGLAPARAEAVPMTPEMRAIPFDQIGIYTSDPGESERAFVLRIAPILQAFTEKTGQEACGLIGQHDGTFGVALGTNHAQIGCLSGEAGIVAGETLTGDSIHSHPRGHIVNLHHADRAFAFATHAAPPDHQYFDGGLDTFSASDYAGGPGYLVTCGHLLYQNESSMRQVIGEVLPDQSTASVGTN